MEGVGLQDCTVLRMDISGFTAVILINSTDKMKGLHPRPVDVTFPLVVCAVLLGWIPLCNTQDFVVLWVSKNLHPRSFLAKKCIKTLPSGNETYHTAGPIS